MTEISKILKILFPQDYLETTKKDIDACKESLSHAKNFRIHTFISTSPLHMKHKLNKTPEQVLESIKKVLPMQENLLMTLNGLVKMEQGLTWITCVKL